MVIMTKKDIVKEISRRAMVDAASAKEYSTYNSLAGRRRVP